MRDAARALLELAAIGGFVLALAAVAVTVHDTDQTSRVARVVEARR